MRPHRLSLTAFGPFAGTVEVDLDALSAAGVFLLHGETGAGKTTLLDAMGFALYGRVPGERGKAKRLRSDHAPDAVRTSVELEVTLAGRRMRIVRWPAQDKPSSRGGTTTTPAKVQLDELIAGEWRSVSTRVGEADAEIHERMGMSADQFFQVVLLPQGEFATFLRADSAERGQLLQRLFGTDRFRAAEEWLAERRRTTAADVAAAQHDVRVLVARLAQAASVDEPEAVPPTWGSEVAASARATADRLHADVVMHRTELARARAAADAAASLAARQDRRRDALDREHVLVAEQPAIDLLRADLAAAGRAAAVAPLLAEAGCRTAEAARARVAEQAARSVLPALSDPLQVVVDRERAHAIRLDALHDVAAALRDESAAASLAAEEAAAARLAAADAAAELAELPARRTELELTLTTARAAQRRLPEVQARLLVVRAAAVDAVALSAAHAAARLHRDELTLAREGAVSLHEKALDIREARVDSMIAELAATLEDEAPCPVCGAVDHPDPSLLVGARVTRDDEERAQTAYEAARQDAEQAAAALAAAEATAASLVARLAEHADCSGAELTATASGLLAEEQSLLLTAAAAEPAESALAALARRAADLESARAAAEVTSSAAMRREAEAGARAQHARDRLATELGGSHDLAAALAAAGTLVESVERALECAQAVERADAEATRAMQAAEQAAIRAGFEGAAHAAEHVRDDAWRAQAESRLRRSEADRVAVATLLTDPELSVPLEPPADVAAARTALDDAERRHEAAAAAGATAGDRALAAEGLAPLLTAAQEALAPLADRAAEIRRLAELVAGTSSSNTLRMSLSSFVLAARLEEVALAASERLLRMTQGRYSLVHTDAGRGGARAGLGLLARDTWTGQDRETSTLSGGETFLASLALALGLADVAAAEAGGARIEALFVDEGFGTLDEDTLDEVMDVLDGLREGGRVVGLVSHVSELRQRIPAQVHVRKARAGSDLTVLGC